MVIHSMIYYFTPTPAQAVVHFFGDLSVREKDRYLQPLRDLGPTIDTVGSCKYLEAQASLAQFLNTARRCRRYCRSGVAKKSTRVILDRFSSNVTSLCEDLPDTVLAASREPSISQRVAFSRRNPLAF